MKKLTVKSVFVAAIFCGVLGFLLPTVLLADDCLRYENYLHWTSRTDLDTPSGKGAHSIAIEGDLAIVSVFEDGLRIVDISVPDFPSVIGAVDTVGTVRGFALNGTQVVLAGGTGHGISIVDITDPALPSVIGQLDLPGLPLDVDVSGNFAFVACGSFGMKVVDISTPGSPTIVGELATPSPYYVTISGDLAFLTGGDGVLRIVDVSNVSLPVQVGELPLAYAYELVVRNGFAYVTTGFGGLQVVDIQDPSSPVVVGSVAASGAWGISLSGDIAYVSTKVEGLIAINVSSPINPSIVSKKNTLDVSIYRTAISGGRIFATAATWPGLLGYKTRNTLTVPVVGSVTSLTASGVAVSGSLAYVAAYGNGLYLIDIADPANPAIVGNAAATYASDCVISGSYTYVADHSSGLKVYDTSTPESPYLYGAVDTPGTAKGVGITGNTVLVADSMSGLCAIDVSDPANPVLGDVLGTHAAVSLTIVGAVAYVATGGGLQTVDISDPAHPAELAYLTTPSYAWHVAVQGPTAVVAGDMGGVYVVDVSNPAAPTLESTVATSDRAMGSALVDGIAYVGDNLGRLIIVDVSDPGNAHVIGGADVSGLAYGAVAAGSQILVYGIPGIAFVDAQCLGLSAVPEEHLSSVRLSRTFPNPFNPRTVIQLSVPQQDAVTLQVYDISGRLVKTLVDGEIRPAGVYDIPWDGRDAGGRSVAAGSYLFKVKVGNYVESGRMTLLK